MHVDLNHLFSTRTPAATAMAGECASTRPTGFLLCTAVLVGAILTLMLTSPALADEVCYVVADNVASSGVDAEKFEDGLLRVDIYSGDEAFIGRTHTTQIETIDFHPVTGVLYAVDGGQLGTINTSTGVFSRVQEKSLGSGTGALGSMAIDNVDGMAFDPTSGLLYGSERRGGADVLIVIDHQTGHILKNAFGQGIDYVVIDPIGSLDDIDDLAFDNNGRLFGTANDNGTGDHLVRIDKATGHTQDLGRIRDAGGAGLDNFEAFTSTPEGKLIGVQGGNAKGVYEIDPTNARGTKLSTLSASSDYESISCMGPDPNVNLKKKVDDPAPEKDDEITFTIHIENVSVDLYDVVVVDKLPKSLKLKDVRASDGDVDVKSDRRTIYWTIGHLRRGESEKLKIDVKVESDSHMENCARVYESSPSLDTSAKSCVSITPSHSSGGGDAGVESDGNLATKLARRLFERRQDVQQKVALNAAPHPVQFDERTTESMAPGVASKSGSFGLSAIVPALGPQGTQAFTVTPKDLLGITNAQSVLAVDYVRPEGRRMAALFAATSPAGVLYDHTKTTCDRLGGGTLDDVSLLDINGRPFVLTRLIHADGATDHAVSFVVYRTGDAIFIDSRFTPDEYDVPETVDEVINMQVWSVAPEYTADLVGSVLDRLGVQDSITYLNTPENAPPAPSYYVKSGRYEHGVLSLRIASGTEAATLLVRGTVADTETNAEQGVRRNFEQTVTVPAATDEDDVAEIAVEVGSVFDAMIEVVHETGSIDQLYYADGSWSHAHGPQSGMSSFITSQHVTSPADGTYVLERAAALTGYVSDWASLFKFLRPGGRPVDLSAYDHLEFTASGRGMVQVVLEKGSIASWDQYSYLISLSPGGRTYQIPYSRFSRSGGNGGFTAEDVTLIAFYIVGNQQFATDFDITVESVQFVGASTVGSDRDAGMPNAVQLAQNFPNPFNPATRIAFELPISAPVRLAVYDVLGREVAVLIDDVRSAGRHEAAFEAQGLSSGTYVYRLQTPTTTLSGTMILMN